MHKKSKKKYTPKAMPFGGFGGAGVFPDLSNLSSLVSGGLNQAFNNPISSSEVQNLVSGISAMTNISSLADMQNNPGIQRMNLAQATVQPNRGFTAPPFSDGGSIMDVNSPVQTEKNEMIILANGNIVNVKAKKKHSQMDKSMVTDLLPEGSYVASADKSTKIKKKLADRISFGYTPVIYDENDESPMQPKEMLFGDIFGNSKTLMPAEITKRIKNKFPLTDRKDDAFAIKTKEENTASRAPYTMVLQAIAEGAKKDSKDSNGIQHFKFGGMTGKTNSFIHKLYQQDMVGGAKRDNAMMNKVDPFGIFSGGSMFAGVSPTVSSGLVSSYDIGGAISGIGDLAGSLIQYFGKRKASKQANRIIDGQETRALEAFNRGQDTIDTAYGNQQQNLNLASASSLFGALAQNPYENREDLSQVYTTVGAMQDSVPQHIKDQQVRQLQTPLRGITKSAMKYSGNYGNSMANIAEMYGSSLNSASNLFGQQAMNDIGLRNQKLGAISNLQSRDANNLANQQNAIRTNENANISSIAGIGTNHFNQLANSDMQKLMSDMYNQGTYNLALNNADQSRLNALGIKLSGQGNLAASISALGTIGSGIFDYYNKDN